MKILLEDILDFIGAEEVVNPDLSRRTAALCSRIRNLLHIKEVARASEDD